MCTSVDHRRQQLSLSKRWGLPLSSTGSRHSLLLHCVGAASAKCCIFPCSQHRQSATHVCQVHRTCDWICKLATRVCISTCGSMCNSITLNLPSLELTGLHNYSLFNSQKSPTYHEKVLLRTGKHANHQKIKKNLSPLLLFII